MAERNFIVLRYEATVPAMAGCEKCKRKFFTPATYARDTFGAQEYLFDKFYHHSCEEPPTQRRINLEKVVVSLTRVNG